MDYFIEPLAVLFTLLSVYLTYKSHRSCWIVGIVGICFYFFIFMNQRNFLNMGLQVIFLSQSIWGWIFWSKDSSISYLGRKKIFTHILFPAFVIAFFLYHVSTYFNGDDIILDSIATSLSLIGLQLTVYKKIESWILWILTDIILILMFFQNNLYLSGFMYIVILCIAISGLCSWVKIKSGK